VNNNAQMKAAMRLMGNIAVNAIVVMTYGQFAWYEPLLMNVLMREELLLMDEMEVVVLDDEEREVRVVGGKSFIEKCDAERLVTDQIWQSSESLTLGNRKARACRCCFLATSKSVNSAGDNRDFATLQRERPSFYLDRASDLPVWE